MLIFLLWLLYFALHSFLAADPVKDRVSEYAPQLYRYYRLAYNILALLGLSLLLFHLIRHPAPRIFPASGLVSGVGFALMAAGTGIAAAVFRQYNLPEFLGTRPFAPAVKQTLITGGTNAWVRHPLYFGLLTALAGIWLLVPTWPVTSAAFAMVVYLPVGIYLEEKKLRRQFGPAYAAYCKRVKRLIPGVW